MDLHTIDHLVRPRGEAELPPFRPGDAALAGGTWLFSEPQDGLARLVDLAGLGWDAVEPAAEGLHLGATCTVAKLLAANLPPAAAALAGFCAAALASSWKVQGTATVGGNLCLALPAGSFIAWAVALDAVCVVRTADGGERRVPAAGFVTGNRQTVLAPGELLRRLEVPAAALGRRVAMRRASLAPEGRSGVLLVGTAGADWALTVTAAIVRPVVLRFPAPPAPGPLRDALRDAIPDALLHDDVHGRPDWRRHMTERLAEEIRGELV